MLPLSHENMSDERLNGFARYFNHYLENVFVSPSAWKWKLEVKNQFEITAGHRLNSYLNPMLRTGLHDIEVARADVGDIKPHSGVMVLFVHGKGRSEKADFVVLADVLLAVINRYLDARGPWGGQRNQAGDQWIRCLRAFLPLPIHFGCLLCHFFPKRQ